MVNITTFEELATVTTLDGTEIVPLNQGGTTKTATTAQIAAVGGLGSYTVASLPTGQAANARALALDANATTFASVVAGGGSNIVPVYFDGTDWRIG